MIKTTTTKKTSTITVDSINKAQQVMIQAMQASPSSHYTNFFQPIITTTMTTLQSIKKVSLPHRRCWY